MKVKCPICKQEVSWENNPTRPFCSERCKTTDLGEWAMGQRSIPTEASEASAETIPNDEGPESPDGGGKDAQPTGGNPKKKS